MDSPLRGQRVSGADDSSDPRAQLRSFVAEMEYPCLREDLIREGRRQKCDDATVALLERLAEAVYSGSRQVLRGLSTA